MKGGASIEKAIKLFSKLPSFGPRSAKRVVLYFIKNKNIIQNFVETLNELEKELQVCEKCHNICTTKICDICANEKRDQTKLCVVCEVDDLWHFEKSNIFSGLYHCLGGNLSAVSGITPEKLNIQSLFNRLINEDFQEIIFTNNLSPEGATTTFYILDEIAHLKSQGLVREDLKITELANGIPIGATIEYMDEGTIKAAFDARRNID